jgi:hypothetical protein
VVCGLFYEAVSIHTNSVVQSVQMPCIQHVLVRLERREPDIILLHPIMFCSATDTKALVLFHCRYALMPSSEPG